MTINARQIEFFARAIVNRLEDRGLVEFGDAEASIDVVVQILSDNFRALESIESEARERLTRNSQGRQPKDDEVDAEMQRVALERSIVL